jgi:hypothetical protein
VHVIAPMFVTRHSEHQIPWKYPITEPTFSKSIRPTSPFANNVRLLDVAQKLHKNTRRSDITGIRVALRSFAFGDDELYAGFYGGRAAHAAASATKAIWSLGIACHRLAGPSVIDVG